MAVIKIKNNTHQTIFDDFNDKNVEISIADGAVLDYFSVCRDHVAVVERNLLVSLGKNCRFHHYNFYFCKGSSNNKITVVFDGEGSECELNGCVVAGGTQRVENHTLIDHKTANCTSNELYKYVLDDKSVGVFEGRILVRQDAQKSVSQETNRNLCLTKESRMFTKPELEIYADDVKCAHGSTVGQLNEQVLFYMQQRGISLPKAKILLQQAFVNEVIERIPDAEMKEKLMSDVEQRLYK